MAKYERVQEPFYLDKKVSITINMVGILTGEEGRGKFE